MSTTKKVLVALSGGVDSSVCVKLLLDSGYEVEAVVMKMSDCHDSAVFAARESARTLGIRLHELDLRETFKKNVIDYFIREYLAARTPNPCTICNPSVKFKNLLMLADELGFDFIATGHYASIRYENGFYCLYRGQSAERDQSYMLYRLKQDVLSRLLLPLSDMTKPQIREIAARMNLKCADAPDSQEICFVEDNDYAKYIEDRCGASKQGEFIAPDGSVCGTHKGIIHYTVGQRKGLGVALGRPAFVTRIDPAENRVYLGFEKASVSSFSLSDISEVYPYSLDSSALCIKMRSTAQLVPCKVDLSDDRSSASVFLDFPCAAVPSGQSGVIYQDDKVLGGGIIEN